MAHIFWEIGIIVILTLLNGFFSMSEIALISIRKTRVAFLAKQGSRRANIIYQLKDKPEKLFATIQIGISVLTIAASAFAGRSLSLEFGAYLEKKDIGIISEYAYNISFVLIVLGITYLSLILGELVPKSLGLRYAETCARAAAYPIWWLSKIATWPVKFLNFSSNIILKPFKDSTSFMESRMSEEEIRMLIAEGRKAGAIEAHEHSIIENVFEYGDLTAGRIMVPRPQIAAFNIDAPAKETIKQAIDSGYSRLPIFKNDLNNIIGILYTKSLLKKLGEEMSNIDLRTYLVAPYFVPGSMRISEVLQRLQRKKLHMALVTNEHGEIEGLVTLEDILEEIVGDITDETDEAKGLIAKQADGSFLVGGEVSILDFNKYFKSLLPEDRDFATLSGFLISELGRFPREGDMVKHRDLEFTVKAKTLRTVKFVLVRKKTG